LLKKRNNKVYGNISRSYPEDQLTKVKDPTSGPTPPVVNGKTFNFRLDKSDLAKGERAGTFLRFTGETEDKTKAIFEDKDENQYEIEWGGKKFQPIRKKVSIYNEQQSEKEKRNVWTKPPLNYLKDLRTPNTPVRKKPTNTPSGRRRSRRK